MAKKTNKQPLLLPIGDQFVDQKSYVSAKTKEVKKANKGASVEEKDISNLVKIALNNEELADETDIMWVEALSGIQADVESGKEHAKELEQEKEKNANKELNVLNAALELDKVDRSALDKHFTSGSNFVDVSPDATDEEVAQKFAVAVVINDFGPWAIGDLGNELQDRNLDGVIDNFCAKTGRSGATIYSHMRLARAVKKEDRNPNILPTVYKELVMPVLSDTPKADAKIKKDLIKQAAKENWNSKEARSAADAAREVPAGAQGGKDKTTKGNFLSVCLKDNECFLTVDEPPFEDDVVVINISKREVLALVQKADGSGEIINWIAIESK